jgi:hypothetical protein
MHTHLVATASWRCEAIRVGRACFEIVRERLCLSGAALDWLTPPSGTAERVEGGGGHRAKFASGIPSGDLFAATGEIAHAQHAQGRKEVECVW